MSQHMRIYVKDVIDNNTINSEDNRNSNSMKFEVKSLQRLNNNTVTRAEQKVVCVCVCACVRACMRVCTSLFCYKHWGSPPLLGELSSLCLRLRLIQKPWETSWRTEPIKSSSKIPKENSLSWEVAQQEHVRRTRREAQNVIRVSRVQQTEQSVQCSGITVKYSGQNDIKITSG
jgi:hypothetical protein